jgi:hypothetical protein
MPTVFEKLNLKSQNEIVVLDPPESFERELAALAGVRILRKLTVAQEVGFALAFVTRKCDLDRVSEQLAKKATDDALLWIVYPKGSSKRYSCDFNRDTGFATLRRLGFDSVRQVAIDEDWSALRFRRNEHIKAKK